MPQSGPGLQYNRLNFRTAPISLPFLPRLGRSRVGPIWKVNMTTFVRFSFSHSTHPSFGGRVPYKSISRRPHTRNRTCARLRVVRCPRLSPISMQMCESVKPNSQFRKRRTPPFVAQIRKLTFSLLIALSLSFVWGPCLASDPSKCKFWLFFFPALFAF